MCRCDVDEQAVAPLASLLHDMRDALAAQEGVDPDSIAVGPVDFGGDDDD